MSVSKILLCFCLALWLSACAAAPETAATPTADATTAAVFVSSTAQAALTAVAAAKNYPTAWDELINLALVEDVNWSSLSGQIVGDPQGGLKDFSMDYPTAWIPGGEVEPRHFAVQNASADANTAGDLAKLELNVLDGPPADTPAGAEQKIRIVGAPATLWMAQLSAEQSMQITALVERYGVYYQFSGTIQLQQPDDHKLRTYQALVLSMISSFLV